MDSYITEYLEVPARLHLPADTEMNKKLLEKLLEIHESNVERWQILDGYYKGQAKIQERTREAHKPNNKIVLAYPRYIVDILLGMFLGKPVSYTTDVDNEDYLYMLQEVFDVNDEQDENTEVGKLASIGGLGYEVVYLDEEGNVKFNEVPATNMIYVYDDNINSEPLFALYVREQHTVDTLGEEGQKVVTVFGRDKVQEWAEGTGGFTLVDETINLFGQVNVIEFINNNERMGDFERVLPLIDQLNLSMSDTANDFQEFTDALLVIYGAMATDSESIKQMQDDKVLLLDGQGQNAEWLIKNINDVAIKNERDNLDEKIHKLSLVPNLSDANFGSATSGESLKYKIYGTDQVISQKQRKFQTALYKRIELITTMINIRNRTDYAANDITIKFNDNKPYDELANIRAVSELLKAGASKQEAFSRLKDLDDVQEEIKRQEEELDPYMQQLDLAIEGDDDDIPANSEEV